MSFDNWAGQRAVIEKLEPRAYLAAGGLDPSFGAGGKVLTDFSAPADSEALAVMVLPDGKVLAAGQAVTDQAHSAFAMARFLSDGRVDATFGDGGQVVLSFGGNAVASDVVRLADGKILAAGTVDGRILVARFSSEGVLDKTFGQGGTVLSAARTDFIYERSCVRVQSDGKIIVAAAGGDSSTTSPAIHLMRLEPSGAIDASFGNGGSLDVDFGFFDYFAGIELRSDDRIVLGGSYIDQNQQSGIELMQFLKNGQVDKSFAGTGQVRGHLFNSQEEIKDIAIDQKGRILLLDAEIRQWGVGRFRADGVLDRSFATRGVRYVEIDTGDAKAKVETGQLAVQADGKILTIGDAFVNFDPTDDMVIARLTDGGLPDASFGAGGIARVVLKDTGHGNALALRADGTILAAGRSGGDMAVVQLGAGGTIDGSFGTAGIATVRLISSGEDAAVAMAAQPDGKLILAGSSVGKDGTLAALARYNVDGSLDKSFGDGGRVRVALAPGAESIRSVAVLGDGRILVAGYIDYGTGFIARFNSDGSVDTTFGQAGSTSLQAVYALKTLADGKFLVVCHSNTQALRRYNADGSLDTSFAAGGILALPGLLVQSNTLALQDDGKILVAGSVIEDPGNGISFYGVWRITAGGLLDDTFGDGGKGLIDVKGFWNDTPYALALQDDGKIVAAGLKTYYFGSDFAVVRLNTDGTPDFSFGDRGVVITPFPPDHGIDFGATTNIAMTVSIQADGRIVVSGIDDVDPSRGSPLPSANVFALARYNRDGSLDGSFGVGGKLTTDFGLNARPGAAFITADGKLIVAGLGQPAATGQDFAIARYLLTDPHPLTAALTNGVLKITGTDVAETIRLRFSNGILSIDGVNQTFARALFSRIEIDGKGGNDSIDASQAPTGVRIDAGAGNDFVMGGDNADVLLGNAGNDTIFGGGGDDTLRGGDGNDYLNSGPGADQIFGDGGNDQVFAVDGTIDTIDGGDGFDRVKKDAGDLLSHAEGLLG